MTVFRRDPMPIQPWSWPSFTLPAAALVIALVWLLPLTTPLNVISGSWIEAITDTPLLVLLLGALAVLALQVARVDPWLGATGVYVTLNAWRAANLWAFLTAAVIVVGAVALTEVRRLPASWRPAAIGLLLSAGVMQTAWAAGQASGVLAMLLNPATPAERFWFGAGFPPHGLLGNPSYLGAMLAFLVPLAPWWLLPVFALGLWLSGSVLATLAAVIGLLVRYHRASWTARGATLYLAPAIRVAGALALGALVWSRTQGVAPWSRRLGAWTIAVLDQANSVVALLVGYGPGAWYWRIPAVQIVSHWHPNELFGQAHHDLLQWQYEHGLVGTALLLGWLWYHREAWGVNALTGALAAIAVESMGFFTFHLAVVGGLALAIIGLWLPPLAAKEA